MKSSRPDVLKEALGRWPGILAGLGLDEKTLSGKHGPCPMCGGKDRFRFDDKQGRGTFYCQQCGAGDGIKLVMLMKGLDFKGALKVVEESMPSSPAVMKAKERTTEEKGAALKRMWEKATPISVGGAVDLYLKSRCIHTRPGALRESIQPYYDDGRRTGEHHAMLARIATVDGKGASLHVTYLTPDGKKAEVSSPKKVMSPVRAIMGSSVQLQPCGEVLGVTEGIETALSAYERFDMPVWATINTEGMAAFIWPQTVKRLVIFADHDRNYAGHKAAYTLAFRAACKGLSVEVQLPHLVGTDWNDVLCEERSLKKAA